MTKVLPLLYKLVNLTLILSLATDRVFSIINIVKNQLHNRIGDWWMNDRWIVLYEKGCMW